MFVFGLGVNFNPFFSNLISLGLRSRDDNFIIFGSFLFQSFSGLNTGVEIRIKNRRKKQIWLGKYEQEFKNDDFIKPKPKEIGRNNGRKSRPNLHPYQTRRSNKPRQPHKPVSQQAKSRYQNRLPPQTKTPPHPMNKTMQRGFRVQEKPRVFPHRTSRRFENSRKPTYAEVVRAPGRFTRRTFERQTNTGYTKSSERPAYFLESTHGGNYRPILESQKPCPRTRRESQRQYLIKPMIE